MNEKQTKKKKQKNTSNWRPACIYRKRNNNTTNNNNNKKISYRIWKSKFVKASLFLKVPQPNLVFIPSLQNGAHKNLQFTDKMLSDQWYQLFCAMVQIIFCKLLWGACYRRRYYPAEASKMWLGGVVVSVSTAAELAILDAVQFFKTFLGCELVFGNMY